MTKPSEPIMRSRASRLPPGPSTATTTSSSVSCMPTGGVDTNEVNPDNPSGSSTRRCNQRSRSSRNASPPGSRNAGSRNASPPVRAGASSWRSRRHGKSAPTLSMMLIACSPFRLTRALLRPNRDLLRLHPEGLGNLDPQHAIPERGADSVCVEILGEPEGPVVVLELELLVVRRGGGPFDAPAAHQLIAPGHDLQAGRPDA